MYRTFLCCLVYSLITDKGFLLIAKRNDSLMI